jgi:uncharacterized protein YyaL (SSP411 family)
MSTNRLGGSTSPYLLQHAHNPVNWYPFGEEALSRARAEEKPVFLSIGYAACHWCHVMERESFENPAVAARLNRDFVCIKVDREERPDLDEIYMAAVVAMTGAGGWPMNLFLTPDLQPFYGGTYYPPEDYYGRPGFGRVLELVVEAWTGRRDAVLSGAAELAAHVRERLGSGPLPGVAPQALDFSLIDGAVRALERSYDPADGGWGSAPKFPSSGSIELLLRHARRTGDARALGWAVHTLDHMARGGLYDQLGGGFHRYSTDDQWLVPHFEKMLYDNAQLATAYLEATQATGSPLFRRVAAETLDYVLRDLCGPKGEFFSSEDADSEGQEGRFYLWTEAEVLGVDDGPLFARAYGVEGGGNFSSHEPYHAGQNILHLPKPLETVAAELGVAAHELETTLAAVRARLLSLRATRVRPGLDDKAVAAWNGLMVSACCRGAQVLDAPQHADAAVRAGHFLMEHMFLDGVLLRSWRAGRGAGPGYLDDYACVANAFVDLYETTFDPAWLRDAEGFMELLLAEFGDPDGPLLFHTSTRHTGIIARSRPVQDGAEPSGNSMAARTLLRLSRHLGRSDWRDRAVAILSSQAGLLATAPQALLKMLHAVDLALADPVELVLAPGDDVREAEPAFLRVIHECFLPHRSLARTIGPDGRPANLPLTRGRGPVGKATAVYLCRGNVCGAPFTNPAELAEKLGKML